MRTPSQWLEGFLFRRGYRKYIPPAPTTFYQHTFTRIEGNLFRCAECGEILIHESDRTNIVFPSLCDPHPRYPLGSVVRLSSPIQVRIQGEPNTYIFVEPGQWCGEGPDDVLHEWDETPQPLVLPGCADEYR